jgi:single-strand DNA-binding protein
MANFNRIIIMGNLTRDPDYKQQPSGQAVCRLSIASNRQYRNKQTGALVQEVCYVDVNVWGTQAENCRQYLQKGRPVLVEGRLKFETWKDAEGQAKQRHSIVADSVVFLGSGQRPEAGAESNGVKSPQEEALSEALFKDEAPFSEELPF